MAAVETSQLSKSQREDLLCTYASLILHDEKLEITEDKLQKLITSAGATVEPYLPGLYVKALSGVQISELLKPCISAAPAAASAAQAADGPAEAAAAKPEEEPQEEEDDEEDMGFSLFG